MAYYYQPVFMLRCKRTGWGNSKATSYEHMPSMENRYICPHTNEMLPHIHTSSINFQNNHLAAKTATNITILNIIQINNNKNML